MAPWNSSDGASSRFTCETCHFEGYGDGRVHDSGRSGVRVTTKPLRGLANNRPHFSRALDRDMAVMVHNEFRVANRTSPRGPWFAIDEADAPWLRALWPPGEAPTALHLSPFALRRALMRFLQTFEHEPNPAVADRRRFSPLEREGAALFRDLCEDCHRAQRAADAPTTRAPFAAWEALVMSPRSALVWADAVYVKTGVLPYPHPDGARVPSLRRLAKKYPYLTSGAARSLADLLARARTGASGFYHEVPAGAAQDAPARAGRPLHASEIPALLAFLALL